MNASKHPTLHCLYCSISLTNRQRKFCTNRCQADFHYATYIEQWKLGQMTGVKGTGEEISNYIRRYIKEKYDNKCALCKWCQVNTHTGNIPLEIDHIDGDFRNNKEDNLILLCPNCHSLTATYKGANKGRGRTSRKK